MTMKPAREAIDVGIVVGDIGASLGFYQGLLGLARIEEFDVPFGRVHRLKFGNSFIKLIEPTDRTKLGPLGICASLGFRYLTFPVCNIDEVCEKAALAGAAFDMEKQELMPGVMVAMVRDPDGNVVELVERRR